MKFATVAFIAFSAACLCAQRTETTRTETTTTSPTVDVSGTLVDQGCYATRTERTKTTSSSENSTTTTETTRVVSECPVSNTTSSFGLFTPDGRYIRFDDAGNTRVVEMMKSNKDWNDYVEHRKPVKVHVLGTANGDTVIIKEIR